LFFESNNTLLYYHTNSELKTGEAGTMYITIQLMIIRTALSFWLNKFCFYSFMSTAHCSHEVITIHTRLLILQH